MILNFPYFLSYVSLFQWICIYILWRRHRTWKLSCLPTFQIFYFQTLKYVQLKFFHYVWRRISGHLKNNYKFLLGYFPISLVTWIYRYFLLLLYLLPASASTWLSTYTHISLPLHFSKIILGEKSSKTKNRVNLKQCREKYPSVDNNIGKVVKALNMIDEIF